MKDTRVMEWIRRRWIYRKIRFFYAPRLRILKPPLFIFIIALATITIFLLGGGVFDVIERNVPTIVPSPSSSASSQQWTFVIRSLSGQTLTESVYSMIFYAVGAAGLYLVFRSTRYAYRRRQAWILLSVGLCMVIMAFIGCEMLLGLKTAF